ncbi:R2-like ligand-binding oxidase [Alicyclobacillus sendaiensis]|uniref:R2-like ligand-binding oxidase n=1 Tax=Alicyclobacillus sendaiensis PA2 TaxID=3029425 RepID=A0ABT6XUF1_ALISE|nr:R2-like ligand-binding oxidase [Alicyclobacillus sendaiensis]MDI9258719.1 R2-like ligand-binding oxidase [Alicyclobacillus sendaiensis PA2]
MKDVVDVEDVDLGHPEDSLDEAARRLWRKAIAFGTWDPSKIDLSQDKLDYERLDPPMRAYLESFCGAFYHAEENVARLFCPWIMAMSSTWQQAYLSTQLVEEFKHADFFSRYFEEVFGASAPKRRFANPVHDSLYERSRQLLASLETSEEERATVIVEAFTHYQGIIEGVQANAGYHIFVHVFGKHGLFPGLSQGFRNIQRDEGRHVGFGMRVLRHYAERDAALGARIREVYEAYLPLIRSRYGQPIEVDGAYYDPPEEERGIERLMEMYERRMRDIFGSQPEVTVL